MAHFSVDIHDRILLYLLQAKANSYLQKVQDLAVKTFSVLCCEGMARVDFFVKGNRVIVNEINTIPGFTRISMYPKLWEASGLPYPELVERLIQLAIERFKEEKKLKTRIEIE